MEENGGKCIRRRKEVRIGANNFTCKCVLLYIGKMILYDWEQDEREKWVMPKGEKTKK